MNRHWSARRSLVAAVGGCSSGGGSTAAGVPEVSSVVQYDHDLHPDRRQDRHLLLRGQECVADDDPRAARFGLACPPWRLPGTRDRAGDGGSGPALHREHFVHSAAHPRRRPAGALPGLWQHGHGARRRTSRRSTCPSTSRWWRTATVRPCCGARSEGYADMEGVVGNRDQLLQHRRRSRTGSPAW